MWWRGTMSWKEIDDKWIIDSEVDSRKQLKRTITIRSMLKVDVKVESISEMSYWKWERGLVNTQKMESDEEVKVNI